MLQCLDKFCQYQIRPGGGWCSILHRLLPEHIGTNKCFMQVHVDDWKVDVQEADSAQQLLYQQQEQPDDDQVVR